LCPCNRVAHVSCYNVCRGSEEAVERSTLAHAAIGAAIATQGPRAVLAVIPLNLEADLDDCDVWLLALLRKYTTQAELCLWGEYLLPRARAFGTLAAKAQHAGVCMSASHVQHCGCIQVAKLCVVPDATRA
jgi:NUC173 domain